MESKLHTEADEEKQTTGFSGNQIITEVEVLQQQRNQISSFRQKPSFNFVYKS
jgi:hypothetical protein